MIVLFFLCVICNVDVFFFFSSRRRHTRCLSDWSSDVCSSDLNDVDPVSQVFRERMTLEAIENGTRRLYRQTHLSRMVFPQELKTVVELAGGFEFVQWFFGFKPHQVLERSRHPIIMVVVLRKK